MRAACVPYASSTGQHKLASSSSRGLRCVADWLTSYAAWKFVGADQLHLSSMSAHYLHSRTEALQTFALF